MEVFELEREDLLDTWLVGSAVRKAFSANSVFQLGLDEQLTGVRKLLASGGYYRILLGVEDDEILSLALLIVPDLADDNPAQVAHFWNAGSSRLRGRMVDAILALLRAEGHMRVWAVNHTGAPDSVWGRMFRRAGEVERIGSIMEVRFRSEETGGEDAA